MKLKEFIKNYICPNTLIRLWKPIKSNSGHEMIYEKDKSEVCMEWELLKDEVWQSKYKDKKIIGITDILTESHKEAVNIVLDIE